MPKRTMVTSLIEITQIEVMCFDAINNVVTNKNFELVGRYRDEEAMLTKLEERKMLPDSFKPLKVVRKNSIDREYGLEVEEFIKYAKPLNPVI